MDIGNSKKYTQFRNHGFDTYPEGDEVANNSLSDVSDQDADDTHENNITILKEPVMNGNAPTIAQKSGSTRKSMKM